MSAKKSQSPKRQLDPRQVVLKAVPHKEVDLNRLAQVLIRIAQESEEDEEQPPKAA